MLFSLLLFSFALEDLVSVILKNKERRYKDWEKKGNKQMLFADYMTECRSKKIYRKIIRVNKRL